MKLIHLSDPHIEPEILHNIDTQKRFYQALEHIRQNHSDADLFVISGDITHYGTNEAYKPNKIIDSNQKKKYETWKN